MILKGKSLALERCFPDLIIFILISHELLFSDRERTSADLDDEGEAASEAKLQRTSSFKGILHQKNFYRLNLIFWIVMGCGISRFGRRGLKTTET